MRKLFQQIEDVFTDTAARKAAAAKARATGSPGTTEASRAVYLNACRQIAEAFAGDGYKFAKSGPHFTKRTGPFHYHVAFQSSHHNIPGQHVVLWMHADVLSPKLGDWRRQQPRPHRNNDLGSWRDGPPPQSKTCHDRMGTGGRLQKRSND